MNKEQAGICLGHSKASEDLIDLQLQSSRLIYELPITMAEPGDEIAEKKSREDIGNGETNVPSFATDHEEEVDLLVHIPRREPLDP